MKHRSGFSLIEIIVVISITILLSSLVIGYGRSSGKQLVLFRDQAVIAGVLNRARALAIEKFYEPEPDFDNCAFGLHFDNGSREYILFRDLGVGGCDDVNYRYDADGVTSGAITLLEEISRFSIDEKLVFANPVADLDILFVPPELDVVSNSSFPVEIIIETIDDGASASVSVSASGQVSMQ